MKLLSRRIVWLFIAVSFVFILSPLPPWEAALFTGYTAGSVLGFYWGERWEQPPHKVRIPRGFRGA